MGIQPKYIQSLLRVNQHHPPKKRSKDQPEADIDSMSSHSSDPEIWDVVGKTLDEIAGGVAEYERGNRRQIAKRHCIGLAGTCCASIQ